MCRAVCVDLAGVIDEDHGVSSSSSVPTSREDWSVWSKCWSAGSSAVEAENAGEAFGWGWTRRTRDADVQRGGEHRGGGRRKARRRSSQRVRSKDRKPGRQRTQRCRAGTGARDEIDRSERADPADRCSSCGDAAAGQGPMMPGTAGRESGTSRRSPWRGCIGCCRRRCGCCGTRSPPVRCRSPRPGPWCTGRASRRRRAVVQQGAACRSSGRRADQSLLGAPVAAGRRPRRRRRRVSSRLEAAGFDAACGTRYAPGRCCAPMRPRSASRSRTSIPKPAHRSQVPSRSSPSAPPTSAWCCWRRHPPDRNRPSARSGCWAAGTEFLVRDDYLRLAPVRRRRPWPGSGCAGARDQRPPRCARPQRPPGVGRAGQRICARPTQAVTAAASPR